MASERNSPEAQLIIIFIWPETPDEQHSLWRGRLKQLPGETVSYFQSWEDLLAQLEHLLPPNFIVSVPPQEGA
ncbi:MAG: hypothetical protein AAF614_37900 [Chloroflexota bacterium]